MSLIYFIVILFIIVIIILFIYKYYSRSNTKIYYFYSPACIHCQKFKNTWDQISKKFNTISIDVTNPKNNKLVSKYNIVNIPTIILVSPNKTIIYKGNRSYNDIYNFIKNNK